MPFLILTFKTSLDTVVYVNEEKNRSYKMVKSLGHLVLVKIFLKSWKQVNLHFAGGFYINK